jgi:hypothetical protein
VANRYFNNNTVIQKSGRGAISSLQSFQRVALEEAVDRFLETKYGQVEMFKQMVKASTKGNVEKMTSCMPESCINEFHSWLDIEIAEGLLDKKRKAQVMSTQTAKKAKNEHQAIIGKISVIENPPTDKPKSNAGRKKSGPKPVDALEEGSGRVAGVPGRKPGMSPPSSGTAWPELISKAYPHFGPVVTEQSVDHVLNFLNNSYGKFNHPVDPFTLLVPENLQTLYLVSFVNEFMPNELTRYNLYLHLTKDTA